MVSVTAYLSVIATVGALTSTVRCWVALADRRDRRSAPKLTDHGRFLTVDP